MGRNYGQLATDVYGVTADEAKIARLKYTAEQAVAADDDGVHAAITGSSTAAKTVTTDIEKMPCARNITVKSGGTSADIAAGKVVIVGEDMNGDEISEEFTITENTAATVTGEKAFASVKSITIPQQDGSGATFKIGYGVKLGLPYKLAGGVIVDAIFDGTVESTKPTLATDADNVSGNTVSLNSSLNAKEVVVFLTL